MVIRLIQPRQQRGRRQHARARRRQFDRQRQSIQPRTERGDRRGVLRRQGEGGPSCPRPLHEQRDRRDAL